MEQKVNTYVPRTDSIAENWGRSAITSAEINKERSAIEDIVDQNYTSIYQLQDAVSMLTQALDYVSSAKEIDDASDSQQPAQMRGTSRLYNQLHDQGSSLKTLIVRLNNIMNSLES